MHSLYNNGVPKLRLDQYLSLFLIGLGLLFSQGGVLINGVPSLLPQPSPQLQPAERVPILQTKYLKQPEGRISVDELEDTFTATLSAKGIYVLDVPSASVLLSKNSDQLLFPASTTKLMTALVVRRSYPLTDILEVGVEATTAGTVVGLKVGEKLPVRDLLAAMLIQSGNDAAQVLANHHPDGFEGFIASMNRMARDLGLEHSVFSNPTGIDQAQQQTSPRDLALLAREVMKDQLLAEIVGTKTDLIQDVSDQVSHQLVNTNILLGTNPGVRGIKTGTTELAGEVLVTQVESDDKELMIVVMGSQDRYADTQQILDWVLTHYIWVDPNSDTLRATQTRN